MPKSSLVRYLLIILVLLAADQISKVLADSYLTLYQPVALFPGFNLTLLYNPGAAFSFLSDAGGWQRWFFTAIAVVMIVVLSIWLHRSRQPLESLALAMILSGAIGNLIDRVLYGHVIDFLDVYYQQHHWPAFNIADSAIVVGVVLLLLTSWRQPKPADDG